MYEIHAYEYTLVNVKQFGWSMYRLTQPQGLNVLRERRLRVIEVNWILSEKWYWQQWIFLS